MALLFFILLLSMLSGEEEWDCKNLPTEAVMKKYYLTKDSIALYSNSFSTAPKTRDLT